MKFFWSLVLLAGFATGARAQEMTFVVHPDVAESSLTEEEVKNVLLGNRTKWRQGTPIKLVVLGASEEHAKIIRDYTQRTTDQFEKFWRRLVFTGAGTLPVQLKTDAEVIAFVAATPGAFGYVTTTSTTERVKVLTIR